MASFHSGLKDSSISLIMKLLALGVTLVVLVAGANGKQIKFEDCSGDDKLAQVLSVDVEPCTEEPCVFKKGTTAKLTTVLKPTKKQINKASIDVTIALDDVKVPYPGIETDLCKKVTCPLVPGQEYKIEYDVPVEDFFPDMTTTMKWIATDDETKGNIFCASAKVGVQGWNKWQIDS